MYNTGDDELDQALLSMEIAHQCLHDMPEPGPDTETVFITLGERDLLAIGLALPVMQLTWPCLGELSQELQLRLVEPVRVQRPEWLLRGDQDSTEDVE